MDSRKAPVAPSDEGKRTLLAILSASIISLLVWACIVVLDIH
jgi:hypothetical protein